jgi:hypothetical protein
MRHPGHLHGRRLITAWKIRKEDITLATATIAAIEKKCPTWDVLRPDASICVFPDSWGIFYNRAVRWCLCRMKIQRGVGKMNVGKSGKMRRGGVEWNEIHQLCRRPRTAQNPKEVSGCMHAWNSDAVEKWMTEHKLCERAPNFFQRTGHAHATTKWGVDLDPPRKLSVMISWTTHRQTRIQYRRVSTNVILEVFPLKSRHSDTRRRICNEGKREVAEKIKVFELRISGAGVEPRRSAS